MLLPSLYIIMAPSDYLVQCFRIFGAYFFIKRHNAESDFAAGKPDGYDVSELYLICRFDRLSVNGYFSARAGIASNGPAFKYAAYFQKFIYSHNTNYITVSC